MEEMIKASYHLTPHTQDSKIYQRVERVAKIPHEMWGGVPPCIIQQKGDKMQTLDRAIEVVQTLLLVFIALKVAS